MWLIIWWGSCNHQALFSFLFWDCVVEPFSLATTSSFLRDGTKMQHALPVWCMFSPWQIFTKMKLLYLKGGWEVRRSLWVWRKGNAASFSWAAGALALACQPEALARIAFFSHWVQQWRRVFGVFFFLHHVASSQENTIDIFLLSSSNQSPSTYVVTLSRAQNACI